MNSIKFPQQTPLFIFEMANNHAGNVNHGIKIVRELKAAVEGFPYSFAVKLQYRDLDTFIHPDFKDRMDVKYVKRFSETRLSDSEFKQLKDEITASGFLAICTPFDENSVDRIEKHGFDAIKIASCSVTDWPLLEKIAASSLPVIASTAAVSLQDIDRVVSFFEHRQRPLALMHCVAEYPTPDNHLQLNQIALLKQRYPNHVVGFSTHEKPDQTDAIKIAVGLGAEIFEKHVGVENETIKLNSYSCSPQEIVPWVRAGGEAIAMCGTRADRHEFSAQELGDLHSLRRGMFARKDIRKGDPIEAAGIFFAIPAIEQQLVANDFSKYTRFVAEDDIAAGKPICSFQIKRVDNRDKINSVVLQVRKFIRKSHIPLPGQVDLEISHHYGIENFPATGACLLSIVNREYCKKLIVMLPGQSHPTHFHKLKEETFHVQYGEMKMTMNGEEHAYKTGDIILVKRGVKHSFSTKTGVIFEEISSTHYVEDSFYVDELITNNKSRKTLLTYWME